jgi:hypothetical protein
MDDLIKRAKVLLKTAKAQRKWWRERCDVESGDPFRETVEVLAALIAKCDRSKQRLN